MSKDELIEKKRQDIIKTLTMASGMIEDEGCDAEHIRGQVLAIIEILKKDAEALERIDEFLKLQKLFVDDM